MRVRIDLPVGSQAKMYLLCSNAHLLLVHRNPTSLLFRPKMQLKISFCYVSNNFTSFLVLELVDIFILLFRREVGFLCTNKEWALLQSKYILA